MGAVQLRPAASVILFCTALAFALSACGGGSPSPAPVAGTAPFDALLEEARGEEVRWWMYGGDARVNAYVDEYVVPAARRRGVRSRRVPVADTADAVQRVVAQRRAGRAAAVRSTWSGSTARTSRPASSAGLWLEDWVSPAAERALRRLRGTRRSPATSRCRSTARRRRGAGRCSSSPMTRCGCRSRRVRFDDLLALGAAATRAASHTRPHRTSPARRSCARSSWPRARMRRSRICASSSR